MTKKQAQAQEPELDENDIPLDDGTKKPPEEEKGAEKQPDPKDAGGEDDPVELKKQLAEAKRKAEEEAAARKMSDERADKLAREREEAAAGKATAEKATLETFKERLSGDLKSTTEKIATLKKQKVDALDKGDNAALVEIDDQINDAKMDYRALKASEADLKRWEDEQAANAKRAKEAPKDGETQYHPEAQKWINKHNRFNTDQEFKADALAAHEAAVNRGINANTPAYFEFIEKRLFRDYPDEFPERSANGHDKKAEEKEAGGGEEPPASSSAAPPSREGGGNGSGKTPAGKVRLTAAELEAAETCGMTPAEYAQEKYGKPLV